MHSDIRLGERPAISDAPELRRRRATLSVCCMTSGGRPALLAAVLASLRAVADEIVVGVEAPHAEEVRAAVADTADAVLGFPRTAPADRPLAWLVGPCAPEAGSSTSTTTRCRRPRSSALCPTSHGGGT